MVTYRLRVLKGVEFVICIVFMCLFVLVGLVWHLILVAVVVCWLMVLVVVCFLLDLTAGCLFFGCLLYVLFCFTGVGVAYVVVSLLAIVII